jgi:hypothetical protein
MPAMLLLMRYVLTAALRDRLIWGVLVGVLLGVSLSVFSASAAIMEQGQFALVYAGGGVRLLVLFGLALFVVFFVRRSFDSRDVEFLLTRPISRTVFVLAHSGAFSLLALMGGVVLMAAVSLLMWGKAAEWEGLFIWSFGVSAEFILVANVAFFFAMVLSSPVTAGLATLGFYVLSRLTGQLLAIIQAPGDFLPGESVLEGAMNVISVVIPRLDLMAQTSWLIYGGAAAENWLFLIVQGAAFLALVIGATMIDLARRQF